MTTAFYAHTDTPDGPFTVIVSDGAVLGSGWTSDPKDLLPRIHQTLLPSALKKSDTEAEFAQILRRRFRRRVANPGSAGFWRVPQPRMGRAARHGSWPVHYVQ